MEERRHERGDRPSTGHQPGCLQCLPELLDERERTLYFRADDGSNGSELWKSDGTSAGTVLVRDIYPGLAVGTRAIWKT